MTEKLKVRKTTIVGTLRRSRREIAPSTSTEKMKQYSTKVLNSSDCTLTIYKCKPIINVLLLSTLHSYVNIGNDKKMKPETIEFYNNTKYGVNGLDQMARNYSVKAGSRRWPLKVFFNILDFNSTINAWIQKKFNTKQ